jgi:hypothetical protein
MNRGNPTSDLALEKQNLGSLPMNSPDGLEDRLKGILEVGPQYFNMEAAIVSKVAGESYKIVIGITRLPFF